MHATCYLVLLMQQCDGGLLSLCRVHRWGTTEAEEVNIEDVSMPPLGRYGHGVTHSFCNAVHVNT